MALLSFGTVLDEGEELTAARVIGRTRAVVMYHATTSAAAPPWLTRYRAGAVARGGRGLPEERHLAIHEGIW